MNQPNQLESKSCRVGSINLNSSAADTLVYVLDLADKIYRQRIPIPSYVDSKMFHSIIMGVLSIPPSIQLAVEIGIINFECGFTSSSQITNSLKHLQDARDFLAKVVIDDLLLVNSTLKSSTEVPQDLNSTEANLVRATTRVLTVTELLRTFAQNESNNYRDLAYIYLRLARRSVTSLTPKLKDALKGLADIDDSTLELFMAGELSDQDFLDRMREISFSLDEFRDELLDLTFPNNA